MAKIKEAIDTIGMKKICLFAHYGLAIGTSLLFFVVSIIATFLPATFDISALFNIWKLILIYCGVIVAFITIKCIFEDLANFDKKIDWIAVFIGLSMLITLGIIITCIIFMFKRGLTDVERQMWSDLVMVFGKIFITEAGGGYLYNMFKKKFCESKVKENISVKEPDKIELSTE